MNEIDFVILWVDGNDPAWREEFVRTRQAENDDASEIRYRDWRNLHYWFRSAERFAPWVRKVHFITWGHLPAWLRRDHPKLHIVNHRDFIPAEYLPTFNSNTIELNIHRIEGLEELLTPMLTFFNHQMTYKIFFHAFETKEAALIYEDRSLTVTTIPLRHRMPCCGFLFAEKPRLNHILRDMIDFYQVPVYELNRIKNGADYVTPEGEVIPNARLTRPSAAPRRYAYCSDTIYLPSITEQIKGVDLLFHEATFAEDAAPRAKETFHTTASQAARIARDAEVKKLLIGHFSARYDDEQVLLDEARAVFPDTQLAKETLCISV